MLRRVVLVITDVSEEIRASFIRVTKIGELGTTVRTEVPEELSTSFIRGTNIGELGTTLVTGNVGAKFLRNVGSYKNHTAQHPRRHHS
jgi:hypothetical protein